MNESGRFPRNARWLTLGALLFTLTGARLGPPPSGHPEPFIAPILDADGSPFLLKETRVHAVVTGPVAHVVVTQRWENPNPFPVDGLYTFPLPEKAAVNDMQLRIGERMVRGEMRRREEARAIYERARREGRVAGLLNQERPNIFSQEVANITPGIRIDVILAFDHEVSCEEGSCEYVFPTVVGPRFIPCHQTDPGLINPPVVEEGRATGQKLSLSVDLEAGVSLRDLNSPSHRVVLTRRDDTRAHVALVEGEAARLNRDFRLRWKLGGDRPELGLLAWRDPDRGGEAGVFTLVLQPPADPSDADAAPRELVFVLDCSGSMRGVPLDAAKNVVRRALGAVRPRDTFQILRFSDHTSGLAPGPLAPTPDNIRSALAYLDALQGEGGTEMILGIRAALHRPADPDRLRVVAFLTDGYIGNEREILAEVRRSIGGARLFSFGIGSSVNRYLLEGLAEEGRGIAAFLGPRETPDDMVDRFLRRIETPVLTDLRITWEDLDVQDLEPATVPDLFAGQALLIHGRYTRPGTGLVVVEGRRRGRREILRKVVILLDREKDHEALGRLWARARVHRLERELHDGPNGNLQETITHLGLTHRLITAYTSLVAVDSLISNPTGASQTVTVPVEMPEDVSYEGIYGNRKLARDSSGGALRQRGYVAAAPSRSTPVVGTAAGAIARQEGAKSKPADAAAESTIEGDEERLGRQSLALATPAASRFTRLTLVREDASRLVVEDDGEVWKIDARTRSVVRTLSATELERLQNLLAAAGPQTWPGARSIAPHLIAEGPWGRALLSLPSAIPSVTQVVQLLESWAL